MDEEEREREREERHVLINESLGHVTDIQAPSSKTVICACLVLTEFVQDNIDSTRTT